MDASRGEPGDEALVARLRQRDTAAFAMLYDRYSRVAFGLAYRMLGESSAAEDVVQEAYLSLWRQSHTFQPERSSLKTWLLSIVHHRAIDRLRKSGPRTPAEAALEGALDRADEGVDVEDQVGAEMEAGEVRRALNVLPPDQRRAIELAYFGGYSHGQIAHLLGVPVGTVKGRLRLGLQKMKNQLDRAGLQGAVHDA